MTGLPLHHVLDGDAGAPVVVLAGSLGTTLEMWEAQVAPLAAHFRVLRYDHPGHGGSPVPERPVAVDDLGESVLALLDELGVERVSFCGLSLGGAVGIWLGSRAPKRVDRLVLACAAARFGEPEPWGERAATVRAEGLEAIVDLVVDGRWFTPAFRAARPGVVERYRRMFLSTPREGYALCCEAIAGLDLRGELSRIRASTAVVTGAGDPVVPPGARDELVEGIPDARLVELAPAAHLASAEQPRAFNAAVLEHLAPVAILR